MASADAADPAGRAAANLAAFVRHCREELDRPGAGPGVDWDSPVWPGARWCKLSVGARRRFAADERLDPDFIDFAKAYHAWTGAHRPSAAGFERQALKCLEAALVDATGSGSLQGLSMSVLDEAANAARPRYTPAVRYHVGRHLANIARLASEKRLSPLDLSTWRPPFAKPQGAGRTDAASRGLANARMPPPGGLEAMAEIFANDPPDPQARFVSAVWALLMCAPWRIGELLRLRVDAEVEDTNDEGGPVYGIRYHGAKGFGADIKWVPKVMEPVAREAFGRIRDMTATARGLARHLETRPARPFLYPDAPRVGPDDALTPGQKAQYLRRPLPKRGAARQAYWRFDTISEHWERARARPPAGFPVLHAATRLRWSEALFAMHAHSLHDGVPTDFYRLEAPTANRVNDLLRPAGSKRGVLAKLGYRGPGGAAIRLTTHQARHYVSTLAERGGMAQEDLARWAGRASPRDNRVYNHMSQEEHVEFARSTFARLGVFGGDAAVEVRAPVPRRELLARGEAGPVQHTEFGFCVHDFVMSPCEKNRDCLNCTEHVCVKGDAEREARIRERHAFLEGERDKALEAIRRGEACADRWLEHNLKSLARLRGLIGVLESGVADGTLLRLEDDGAEHSHVRRVLDRHLPRARATPLEDRVRGLLEAHGRG